MNQNAVEWVIFDTRVWFVSNPVTVQTSPSLYRSAVSPRSYCLVTCSFLFVTMLKTSLLVTAPVRRFTTSAYMRSAGNPHSKIHGLPFKLSEDKAKSLINLTAYVNEHTFASIFKILGSVSEILFSIITRIHLAKLLRGRR